MHTKSVTLTSSVSSRTQTQTVKHKVNCINFIVQASIVNTAYQLINLHKL